MEDEETLILLYHYETANQLCTVSQPRDEPEQAEFHVKEPGSSVQPRDEPEQAEFHVEEPDSSVQPRDEPEQAEFHVGSLVEAK